MLESHHINIHNTHKYNNRLLYYIEFDSWVNHYHLFKHELCRQTVFLGPHTLQAWYIGAYYYSACEQCVEGIFSVHSRLVTQYPGLLLLLKCIHNIHGNKDNVYTINQNKIRQRSQ